MISMLSLQNSVSFDLFHLIFQGQTCVLLQVSLDCLLLHSSEKDIFFFCISSRRSCRSSQNKSTSVFSALVLGAQAWITVRLNGLLWKQIKIILSFLRLHPSNALQTLLLTMKTTLFLLMDCNPQQQIQWSSELNQPIPTHFSSLMCKMSMLTCTISYLTTSNTLTHGPNIPGSYETLFFTASEFTVTTTHGHN